MFITAGQVLCMLHLVDWNAEAGNQASDDISFSDSCCGVLAVCAQVWLLKFQFGCSAVRHTITPNSKSAVQEHGGTFNGTWGQAKVLSYSAAVVRAYCLGSTSCRCGTQLSTTALHRHTPQLSATLPRFGRAQPAYKAAYTGQLACGVVCK